MNMVIIFGLIIGCVIGTILGHLTAGYLLSSHEVIIYRFINRVHRYVIVPLFRRKWDSFDEYWYNKWERKAKKRI